jgi:hypothetical protein
MPKKPKKAKTPKAPKGRGGIGGGKDPVTGLAINLEGIGKVISDKVYDKDSAVAKEWFSYFAYQSPDITESFIEFEFSDKYIVGTTQQRYANGDTQTIRLVMQGLFKYKGERISSATVAFLAEDNIAPGSFYGTTTPNLSGEVLGTRGGSKTIPNPNSLFSWAETLSGFEEENNKLLEYNNGDIGNGIQSTGDESAVRAFAGGKFFQEGWWNNPFAPNLV